MRNYKWTLLTVLFAIFSVIALAGINGLFESVPKNGFNRKFLGELGVAYTNQKTSAIKRYIGEKDNRLWFSTSEADVLYSSDLLLQDFRKVKLKFPINQKWQNAFLHFFTNGYLYSWAPQVPALYETSVDRDAKIRVIKLPYTFTRAQIISANSVLLRAFVPTGKSYEQAFIKICFPRDSIIENRKVAEDRDDLGMLTDGMLHYDTASHVAIYVQYFSNNITWLDTNLNIIRRSHTIDTFASIGASMEIFQNGERIRKATFNAPPKFVNIYSCVYKGLLFNYSGKRADNEEAEGYVGGSKIDIYSFIDGKYLGTWKVPSFGKDFMESFDIIDGQLIAIYKNQIILFKSEQALLDRFR